MSVTDVISRASLHFFPGIDETVVFVFISSSQLLFTGYHPDIYGRHTHTILLQRISYVSIRVISTRFPLQTMNFQLSITETKLATHCWFCVVCSVWHEDHTHMSVLVTNVCQVFPKFGTGILLP
jgi:hypothetical protein